ncbi:MAG: succinylglutamate desuccinylase/aspartoacylase family protein [Deltaproteobacteria bacterium]|nr:succinylglutamate desuccinylase/aspartoacylase family protein [Deltaproteobacteria bacterium]
MTLLSPGIHHLGPTLPVHVLQAAEPGPTALVEGGIHGDEVAGVHAISELLEEGYAPRRGRLILIPVMNPAAYRARTRAAPGGLDMNRVFPGDPSAPEVERRQAHALFSLMKAEDPALIVTLHESLKRFHPEVPLSFGQTVVYGVRPMPALVQRVVDAMNAELQHPYELWAPHYYPVSTSSTEVIVDALGCVGLTVETWSGFDEARRVQMQRQVVDLLLREIGVR